jgi:photosystem II stability/assembly factor-like uncharacterized protein
MKNNKVIKFHCFQGTTNWPVMLLLLLAIGAFSCTKRSTAFLPKFVESPTSFNLYDICFTNSDTGFIVGGDKFVDGIVLHTYDGGKTWLLKDSVSLWVLNGISINSLHQVFIVGHTGKILFNNAADTTWSSFQTSGWEELYAVHFINDTLGVAVGGESFDKGVIQRITPADKGVWQSQTKGNLLQDVQMVTEKVGYTCGFGAVYKTIDGAKTWKTTPAKGDFFRGISFINTEIGYVVGKGGSILKTTNGGDSWISLRNGNSLFNKDWKFNDVLFVDANIGFVAGDNGILLRTLNGGKTWELSDYFSAANNNKLYLRPNKELWLIGDGGTLFTIPI